MKSLTIDDIRRLKPCYNPSKYLEEDFNGTIVDILNNEEIPYMDRVWVTIKLKIISKEKLKSFNVWCYKQIFNFIETLPSNNRTRIFYSSDMYVESESNITRCSYAVAETLIECAVFSTPKGFGRTSIMIDMRKLFVTKLLEMVKES